jgi:TRAP-type C4-dicarboxylate transport system substrate-binding protein
MVAVPLKFYDLVKYYNDTRHAMVTSLAVVSIKWMNSLPRDLQKAVVEEARALHKELLDFSKAKSDQLVKIWKGQPKNEFIELTAAERKEFKDQAISVYGKFYKNHPAQKPLVEQIQAEVKKLQGTAR